MAGKLTEVSAGVIAVNAANRMPTDNKEKEPRSFNHPFPSVTSTQGHNKGHRAQRAQSQSDVLQISAYTSSSVLIMPLGALCPLAQRVVKKKSCLG